MDTRSVASISVLRFQIFASIEQCSIPSQKLDCTLLKWCFMIYDILLTSFLVQSCCNLINRTTNSPSTSPSATFIFGARKSVLESIRIMERRTGARNRSQISGLESIYGAGFWHAPNIVSGERARSYKLFNRTIVQYWGYGVGPPKMNFWTDVAGLFAGWTSFLLPKHHNSVKALKHNIITEVHYMRQLHFKHKPHQSVWKTVWLTSENFAQK